MAYLRLLINPDDDNALLRIINVPRRRIGPTTLEVLDGYAQERQKSLYSCIPEMRLTTRLDPEATRRLSQFYDLVEGAKHDLCLVGVYKQSMNYSRISTTVTGYRTKVPESADHRWGNVTQFLEALRKDLKVNPDEMLNEDGTNSDDSVIEMAIRKLILREILEQEEEEDHSDRVQLSTLHAAKGPNFPMSLVGAEEELLPKNLLKPTPLRRSGANVRRDYPQNKTRSRPMLETEAPESFLETIPSRLLDELTEEHLHW